MKVVKPMKAGVLTRPFEMAGRCYFSVAVMAFFRFDGAGLEALLPEIALWKLVGDELGRESIFDEAMPKPRGEVLLSARAYPPHGAAVAVTPRVTIGSVDKSLLVVGDRRWVDGAMTSPEPFSEMPLSWSRSFGGEGFARNPTGRGHSPVQSPQGRVHPLPNVEDPARRITRIDDRPEPAGFGPLDFALPQRQRLLGTYDERWQRDFMPGFAEDLDPTAFQQAPEDQRVEGFFAGDEPFVVEHMHPTRPRVEGRLPAVAARCFITLREGGAGTRLVEVAPRLDTVWLFPHHEKGALVFRALLETEEDDGHDVVHLLAALEHLDAPKPGAHYERVLAQRLDRQTGWTALLREGDLVPEPHGGPAPKHTDGIDERIFSLTQPDQLMRANMRRGAEAQHAKVRAHLVSLGVEPDDYLAPLPEDPAEPSLDELPDMIEKARESIEQQRIDGERKRAEAMADARSKAAEHGITLDFLERPDDVPGGGPPRFSARGQMQSLRAQMEKARSFNTPVAQLEAMIADPEFETRLIEAEDRLREVYRRFAHYMPAAAPLAVTESEALRQRVRARLDGGGSLSGEDLTGADLSGMDLRGADLRGAWLERATLTAADLRGANLSGAVLARAELSDARLDGVRGEDLNLGAAVLRRASLAGAVLVGAQLGRADLRGASLRGCSLERCDLSEVQGEGVDLGDTTAEQLIVREARLSGAVFTGARWTKCVFLKCAMQGAVLSGATMISCVLLECSAEGLVGEGATLDNLRAVSGTSLRGARLRGASIERSTLRGVSLVEADLSEARLNETDLSEADLRGARLERITANDSRWVRADLSGADLRGARLFQAVMQKAMVQGASFERANLSRADMARVRGRPATLEGALLTHVRVLRRGAET